MVTTTAPAKATKAQLRESLAERDAVLTMLMERLPELEAQLQEDGWNRIEGAGEREFSREGLRRIIAMSRLMFLKNPLINRGVMVQTLYVWGQGVTIQGRDEDVDELVQDFLNDPKNKVELTSHQARTLKEIELQVTGNLFFCLFPSRVTGKVRIRTIPVEEIDDIICNPEDAKDPWFYKRVWSESRMDPANGNMTTKTVTAFYPDWRHTPKDKPSHFGSAPVMWDTPVYHVKVGGFDTMRFGVPETYQALDWARAYKSMLEDWATITRALSRFAWNVTTPGGTRGIAAAKSKLATTEGNGSGANSRETNPPPTTAST
ncbi:MAG: hypothetical protein NTZ05_11715, partial [Chloroflexi bacterium]|nr:hypothetical protein [Chloroflexota bacterium]